MPDYVLEAENLTMRFGTDTALDSINLKLEREHIYGFVGNNGAGKTTFMRIASGLIRQSSGKLRLFGAENEQQNSLSRRRVGFIVESPIYYGEMSARQNLIAQSIISGRIDNKQIKELISLVGLNSAKGKKLSKYSTGMKQRFGLAFALLGNPDLLMLDEPLNGLDVEGMDTITKVLKKLNKEQNMTMFISSHLLARLHQIATDYIFINLGKVIQTISAEELGQKYGERDLEEYFRKLVKADMDERGLV